MSSTLASLWADDPTDPLVTVLVNKYAPQLDPSSTDAVAPDEKAWTVPLSEALTRRYSRDAHFAQYACVDNDRRLGRKALEHGFAVKLGCIVFDVDCPATHGSPTPAPERWRVELRAKVANLAVEHPAPVYYETKGGARIVYRQLETFVVAEARDAQRWTQEYEVARTYFARRFAIEVDACGDWPRLFRLPHATRTPGGTPEAWPSLGDPKHVGALKIEPTRADVHAAMKSSRAFFGQWRNERSRPELRGTGILFHLVAIRDAIMREHHSDGAFVVVCPRQERHSTGSDGDGSTLLFPPTEAHPQGTVYCLHSHCERFRGFEWFSEFSIDELKEAERRMKDSDR